MGAAEESINNAIATKFKDMAQAPASSTAGSATESKLRVEIKKLTKQLAEAKSKGTEGTTKPKGQLGPYEWQSKKMGDTMQRNGVNWWWCPHHRGGEGLYVQHKPENHSKWEETKKQKIPRHKDL